MITEFPHSICPSLRENSYQAFAQHNSSLLRIKSVSGIYRAHFISSVDTSRFSCLFASQVNLITNKESMYFTLYLNPASFFSPLRLIIFPNFVTWLTSQHQQKYLIEHKQQNLEGPVAEQNRLPFLPPLHSHGSCHLKRLNKLQSFAYFA